MRKDSKNAVVEYKHDGIGRLVEEAAPGIRESYKYDRAGNRVSRVTDKGISESYTYNEVNELLSIEKSSIDGMADEVRKFTYDKDGNMISDGRGIYNYDSLDRMSGAVMNDGGKLLCRYDAEGLRHETEENGKLIKFIYSGRDAVCEEADDTYTRYIRGNGRIVASDCEQARTYYHYVCDSLGSVTHMLSGNEYDCSYNRDDDVSRRLLCRYEYDAFGNTVSAKEDVTNRYGFAGEMRDGITGQYYLRARYYMQEIGRFTQADMYHGDGLNLYVYAGSNPVMYVDPSGHECGKPEIDESGIFSRLPVDENGNIVFYHGTTAEAAASIRQNGVDLDYATRDMDFGRGFYVTTDVNQANTWAKRLGNRNNTSGDVVVFEISESDFNKLNNKNFDSPDAEWGKTVVDGRNGVQPPYDTVSGPYLRNVVGATKYGAIPKGEGQQTTFLSDKSIDLLNSGMKGKSI